MRRVLFVDSQSEVPYDERSPGDPACAIGGSEATLARIAAGLATDRHIDVVQMARTEHHHGGGVHWHPWSALAELAARADAIVVQRHDALAPRLRRWSRTARIVLWLHDSIDLAGAPSSTLRAELRALTYRMVGVTRVCVSPFHAENVRAALDLGRMAPRLFRPDIRVICNPVIAHAPDPCPPLDRDKLVYCSAPTNRLPMILDAFAAVRAAIPSMRLHLACPAYDQFDPEALPPDSGVVAMGPLPQTRLHAELADALCLFYPQSNVAEAFGLVFAEAHALGTPALAHDFGAARDLLSPEERIDARDIPAVVARIIAWRDGARPAVARNPAFALETILDQWRGLLG
ncbi:glycosyltransferase [Novosphingobium sp. KCTC 2891]|uniref:glycosyltransferase n=1 Tax=Novosphingobium sp. KCTC 2891 TaxID=2989730 RepID=UPI002221EA57|nr:glycosyltransferase [Novosphingobium sp. KCTC 2891]MCW1381428.1 glycosyltransferase [Novosphingobium sp. KCTC 2891]